MTFNRTAIAMLAVGAANAVETATQMPIAELKAQYIAASSPLKASAAYNITSSFVFLQKFPLGGISLFYHTEILVCPRDGFSKEDQDTLDGKIVGMTNFAQIDDSWWTTRTANCIELGYGGADCSSECCSVPHGPSQTQFPLNARRSVIGNADVSKKTVFIYGTGDFDGNTAYHYTCDSKCWSNWAGTDYNPLTNNCNTFTSTVLSCVYGLSQKKPNLGVSDMVTVSGHCQGTGKAGEASSAETETATQMPIAKLKEEYVAAPSSVAVNAAYNITSSFVFLQKFPLGGVSLFYHTEVLVCPRDGFSKEDQDTLDGKIVSMTNFAQIDDSWWTTRTANCIELGYGGADCSSECCSVPNGPSQTQFPLNARRSVIGNADVSQKSVFIYGTGDFDGNTAYHYTCDSKCWSNWAGTDYNPLTNNCNTFTSTVLSCVYGLSQKKPHLGVSDMVTVSGVCQGTDKAIVV